MSWSINIPVVSTLKLALGNAAHDQVLGNADLGGSKPIPIPGGQVSLGAALKASVELFNDPDDKDAHGIIGVAPKESDGSTVEPLYSPDGTACWLKYAAQLDAEATGQGPFPFVELSGGGTVQVLVTDYRQHTATQTLEAALGADAKSLRLPFLLGDVQALRPGDALSFQSALELKAGVKVSWSILSTSLASALAKRLAGRLVFDFNVEAGASIGGTVSLKDEFRLVFSRPTFDGPFRVSVRKATSDSAGTQVGVGVTLQYSSPLLAAILGAVDSRVQDALKLVEGLENNALTPVLLQVAGAVLKQLGFLKSSDLTLASIRAAYDELKAFVDSVVSGALKAAFTYEYVRSTEDSTLLELEVPADQLASAHGDFISGDLASIQGRVKNAWLKRYFHMKTVESERSWGLGLSWRDVNFATQEDRRKLKAVVQHASRDHRNGPRRYAFQGARSYSSAGLLYGGKTSSWGTDFSAQMPRYSLTPSADEFEFAFFAQRKVEDTLSKELIQSELDAATVWGILRPEDLVELVERFFRVAASGTQASSRLELRVDTDSFRKLLAKLGTEPVLERQAFARALARAMPRDSQPVRRNIDRREELYTPLWDAYLKDGGRDWTLDRARANVGYHLKTHAGADGASAAQWELSGRTGTFSDVLVQSSRYGGDIGGRPYGKVHAFWKDLLDKLSALNKAIQSETVIPENDATSVVQQAFVALDDLVCDDFRVAAFMGWLDLLGKRWGLEAGMQRSLTIQVGEQRFVTSHG